MHVDSLLIAMSSIFRISHVFGSESRAMVKPMFLGCHWGISRYPTEGKYMDEIYEPVWERIGSWKKVDPGQKLLTPVQTPFTGSSGNLEFNKEDYLSLEKHKKKMQRKIKKLKPGKYHLSRK
jgi:hypothetical protein